LDVTHLEKQIRAAYYDLSVKPQDWVRLARLMAHKELSVLYADVVDVATVKDALFGMYKRGEIVLVPESNRKMLTPADRALAVRVGGEDNHLMAIASE
jgi:hypothetical protein